MTNTYSGIEEYPNAFEPEYCEEIIKHFDTQLKKN